MWLGLNSCPFVALIRSLSDEAATHGFAGLIVGEVGSIRGRSFASFASSARGADQNWNLTAP
jgi:murein endopeptidase